MLSNIIMHGLLSDQLYAWSDGSKGKTCCHTSKASPCACKSVASAAFRSAWLAHRAVQALRKAWMQVCRWTGTWTQVLSFRELSRAAAADGLHPPGRSRAGFRTSRQLSTNQRDSGGDQRDQPRVAASSRGALTRHHEPVLSRSSYPDRRGSWWRIFGQYVGRLARRNPGEFILTGGRR
jgi:hypothetical protein